MTSIREKAIQRIPFYDTGILIVEPDTFRHYDVAVTIKGWDNSAANLISQAEEGLIKITHPGSYLDDILHRLEKNKTPLIENWEQLFDEWDHPFFPFIKDAGYKKGLVALLKSGDRILGGFWLNSLDKNHFTKGQLPLFKAMAEQVSVAVVNILVRKEILEGEKEKTILLLISEAVATIRNKQALFKFVFEKVQPLLGFATSFNYLLFEYKIFRKIIPDRLWQNLGVRYLTLFYLWYQLPIRFYQNIHQPSDMLIMN